MATASERLGAFDAALHRAREALQVHQEAVELAHHLAGEHAAFTGRAHRLELLAGVREPGTSQDHVLLGHAFYARHEDARAAAHVEAALRDPDVRADLDQAILYWAVCAAARVAGEDAASWHDKALAWLAEDLTQRRELLRRIDAELQQDPDPERTEQLMGVRRSLLHHLGHARARDPDLTSLRERPEFMALFPEADPLSR